MAAIDGVHTSLLGRVEMLTSTRLTTIRPNPDMRGVDGPVFKQDIIPAPF
jgi:hypothetical protein